MKLQAPCTRFKNILTEQDYCVSVSRCQQCGGCRGGLGVERLGLPCAGHRQFHPTPADPQQDTAEPLSQNGGTLEKIQLRNAVQAEEQGTERVGNSRGNTKIRGGGAPHARADTPLQLLVRSRP